VSSEAEKFERDLGAVLVTTLRESQLSLKEANQLKLSFQADACQARLRMMRAAGKIIP
jgi:hypothetical protein